MHWYLDTLLCDQAVIRKRDECCIGEGFKDCTLHQEIKVLDSA